jgi:poly(3-hydroxybutyrate) depolymerase
MLYYAHEAAHVAMAPLRVALNSGIAALEQPFNPLRYTSAGRVMAAALDSLEHATRRFGKPSFDLAETWIDGQPVAVTERVVDSRTWCDLLRFERAVPRPDDPRLLIVAPLSGHFATLLRGTVEAFLPDHEVHITDWCDARNVPVYADDFTFADYVDLVRQHLALVGPRAHVLAVCQPAVPVLAAVALMSAYGDPALPASMTLIGGPIDTREAPTEVNLFAKRHSIGWFRRHTIHRVPFGNPGFLRRVYPGFLQLAGFMAMNLDRHVEAHWEMFQHLVEGDGETLAGKRAFYEEYRAVMDLPADYYLETIETVFHKHLLPDGKLFVRGERVDCGAVTRTALMTVEGERDDISGIGQTRAAHRLCGRLPDAKRMHWEQPGVGHYGVFNGRRFRESVAPRIKAFIRAHAA